MKKWVFLTGDVNWKQFGAKWFKIDSYDDNYCYVIEIINFEDATGEKIKVDEVEYRSQPEHRQPRPHPGHPGAGPLRQGARGGASDRCAPRRADRRICACKRASFSLKGVFCALFDLPQRRATMTSYPIARRGAQGN